MCLFSSAGANLAFIHSALYISVTCVGKVVHDTVYNGREHGAGTHDHPIISLFQNDSSSIDRGGSRDNLGRHSVQVDA